MQWRKSQGMVQEHNEGIVWGNTCYWSIGFPVFLITTAAEVFAYYLSTTALLIEAIMQWSTTTYLVPWDGVWNSLAARISNTNRNPVLCFIWAAYFPCRLNIAWRSCSWKGKIDNIPYYLLLSVVVLKASWSRKSRWGGQEGKIKHHQLHIHLWCRDSYNDQGES